MKKFESFILHGCGFTVLLALILYAFLAISGVIDQGIPVLKFLVVFGYGLVISGARELYASLPFGKAVRLMIHYLMILAGFLVLYFTSGAFSAITPAKVFIAIILFSILYTAIMLGKSGIGRFVKKAEPQASPTSKKAPVKGTQKKGGYTPRFGGDQK